MRVVLDYFISTCEDFLCIFRMLRVESSDFVSYTEFEEGIHFDEDDPDFARQQDVMPSISLPLVLRGESLFTTLYYICIIFCAKLKCVTFVHC